MKRAEIIKTIKKQIENHDKVKELRLSPAWHDVVKKLIKNEKTLFGIRVYQDRTVKFMQVL